MTTAKTFNRHACILPALLVLLVSWWGGAPPSARGQQTDAQDAEASHVPVLSYEVVRVFPHDRAAFCQGLVIDDGVLYEGTGKYGQSTLRQVDLASGRVVRFLRLNARYFGEGVAVWGNQIVQLTWRRGVALVVDKETFRPQGTLRYQGEGWGLTHDGTHFILSDGTARLRFLDPATFQVAREVVVRAAGRPVEKLNELEYVEGSILANIWYSDRIARIDPATGNVTAWIDLTGLLSSRERQNREAVLNGIAYDASARRLYVTGKYWPKLFEIRILEP